MGLYYAWEGITRFSDGVATVNLFLNRSSAWMDVDSFLPYEGKVELSNKQARVALARVPNWVEMGEIKAYVNGRAMRPARSGRYLVFDGLQNGSTIRLEFPNPERTDRHTIADQSYRITFRGSTVLDIQPKADHRSGAIPLYQRSHYRAETAPARKLRRFAAERVLPLQ